MAVKGLEYVIYLTDKMTSPLKGITKSVDNFTTKTKASMKSIAMGGAGLFAVGKSMQAALMPAIEMDRALGELASLDVADSALKKLTKAAMQFGVEYGKSSVDVIKSAYGIRQAFGNVSDDELVGLTITTSVLAGATKDNAENAKNYMARMYAIFQNQANAIGKVKWAEQIASQTAIATKLFKTSSSQMEAAMKTVATTAQSAGVDTADLFAVLGQLGDKIGETKAAKQYESFLMGIDQAQSAMGVSFKDSTGKLLSTDKILALVKKRFGDIQHNKDAISKAFGGEAAYKFILNLAGETDRLSKNIIKLGDTKGLKAVSDQAHKMTDPWERLEALIFNISAAIGGTLQPKLYPILNSVIDIGQEFVKWLNTYPNIARWIGYLVTGLMGFAVVGSVIMLLKGIFGLWWGSMSGAFSILMKLSKAIKLNILFSKLWGATLFILNTVFKAVRVGAMLMWTSISLPIAAVIAAIALVGYVIYSNWEKIKAWGSSLWGRLVEGWNNFVGWLKGLWDGVVQFFEEFNPLATFLSFAESIKSTFLNVFKWLKEKVIGFINWYIDKANKITGLIGIEIPKISLDEKVDAATQAPSVATNTNIAPALNPIKAQKAPNLGKNLTTTQNVDKSVNFNGNITIQAQNPAEFAQWGRD